MKVSLLRHGKTMADDIYRGHTDVALTVDGLAQMQQTFAGFSLPVDYLVSSPLCRCAQFADSIEPKTHLDERLKEISFGDWDGKSRPYVWNAYPEAVTAFWNNPMESSAPNGETVSQLQTRVMEALHDHVKVAIVQKSEHLLLVTHGGVIRAILGAILHMDAKGMFNVNLPYASVAYLKVTSFDNESGQPDYHLSLDFSS